jgi:hypothetical protein
MAVREGIEPSEALKPRMFSKHLRKTDIRVLTIKIGASGRTRIRMLIQLSFLPIRSWRLY